MTLHVENFGSVGELRKFANGAAALGSITMFDPKDLTDEQSITLNDGVNPATVFRIDLAGDGVGGGATPVDVSLVAAGDKVALAVAWATAINSVGAGLAITATASGTKVALVNDAVGVAGNQPLIQSAAALQFGLEGMSGGAAAVTTADIIQIREHSNRWYMFWKT